MRPWKGHENAKFETKVVAIRELVSRGMWGLMMALVGYGSNDIKLKVEEKVEVMLCQVKSTWLSFSAWGEHLSIQLWWETDLHCSHRSKPYSHSEWFICLFLVVRGTWNAVIMKAYCEESVALKSVQSNMFKIVTRKMKIIKSNGSIKLNKLIGSVQMDYVNYVAAANGWKAVRLSCKVILI